MPEPEGQANGVADGQQADLEEAQPLEAPSETGEPKKPEPDITTEQGEPLNADAGTTPEVGGEATTALSEGTTEAVEGDAKAENAQRLQKHLLQQGRLSKMGHSLR